MPSSAKLSSAAGAVRLGERLAALAIDHRVALGVLFLIACGWKLTLGLEYVLDLRLGDETKYLALATGYSSGPLLPEWSPLYVYFYRLEHLFAADPVRLFFLHEKVLATLVPIAFFVYLATRSVPFLPALAAAVYLLVSIADLPVGPKTLHLAVALMFLALAAFVRLGASPAKWGLMIALGGVLSLVRAEYLIPLALVTLYACVMLAAERRLDWRGAASICGGLLAVAALYAHFGSPLFGGRSVFAFAQHYALNYAGWQHLHQDPWTTDYRAVFQSTFGDAQSIPAAFLANPPAFAHHVLTNAVRVPIVLAGLFFGHYNLLLPRFQTFTLIEAGLLMALVLFYVGSRLRGIAFSGWREGGIGRLVAAAHGNPDIVCLLIFLLPFAVMMLVLYPRYHYALAFGTIVFALALIGAAPRLPGRDLGARAFLALPLLLAFVPSIGSAGVRVDTRLGDVTLDPRPGIGTVEYLHSLGLRAPAVILEPQVPGVGAYLGSNYTEVPEEDKTGGFADFIKSRQVSIIVANDRMNQDPRFADDPQWRRFITDPAAFGFIEHTLPDEGEAIYLAEPLLRSR